MDGEKPPNPVSRRKLLKRIGAGAALAWSAPILTSVRAPAFAAGASPECPECHAWDCVNPVPPCRGGQCDCVLVVGGDCFCAGAIFCGPGCTKDSDCPQGSRCAIFTCDVGCGKVINLCADPCLFDARRHAGRIQISRAHPPHGR